MFKNNSAPCNSMLETNSDEQEICEDVDSKIQELLKFQYNMIVKLEEVIEKLEKINA